MEPIRAHYRSYLLRLWRAGEEDVWQIMLEHVDTHQRQGFADLESLTTFLREQMQEKNSAPETLSSK